MGGGERIEVDVERLRVVNEPESDQQTLINKCQWNCAVWKRDDRPLSANTGGRGGLTQQIHCDYIVIF